jgi:hypothetical protein
MRDFDWIDLARDRDRWRVIVKAVINSVLHKMRGISYLAESLLAFQERLLYVFS